MDIKYYKYKNKIWQFLPKWLFNKFHKPTAVYEGCYPVSMGHKINSDGTIEVDVNMVTAPAPIPSLTFTVKFDELSENQSVAEVFEKWQSVIKGK